MYRVLTVSIVRAGVYQWIYHQMGRKNRSNTIRGHSTVKLSIRFRNRCVSICWTSLFCGKWQFKTQILVKFLLDRYTNSRSNPTVIDRFFFLSVECGFYNSSVSPNERSTWTNFAFIIPSDFRSKIERDYCHRTFVRK